MSESCRNCVYAEKKDGNAYWCKYMDRTVNNNLVCDNYMYFLDSPQMTELLEDIYGNDGQKRTERREQNVSIPRGQGVSFNYHLRDFMAWILAILLIAVGIIVFLYC